MKYSTHILHPIPPELCIKISILKSIMYCGVLWGLYDQGWAIKSEESDFIFPFWLNSTQALRYAKQHWPNYQPKRITPDDFAKSLLPTLSKFKVTPALYTSTQLKFKLSARQMHLFFQPSPRLCLA